MAEDTETPETTDPLDGVNLDTLEAAAPKKEPAKEPEKPADDDSTDADVPGEGEGEDAGEPGEGDAGGESGEAEGQAQTRTQATAADGEPAGQAAAQAPSAPPADPQAAERQKRYDRLATVNREINELHAKLDSDDYDPYTDGKRINKLQIEAGNLREQIYAEQIEAANVRTQAVEMERQADTYWAEYAAEHPAVGPRARKLYTEEFERTRDEYPNHHPDAVQLLATERFKHRVATLEGKARAGAVENTPPRRPPPTPSGNRPPAAPAKGATGSGRVLPPGVTGARQSGDTSPEAEFARVAAPGIRGFLED